jgi:Na+-driven multidrug efflux pump
MLMFALSGSIGPFVGQNWGAHLVGRVRQGVNVSYQFCLVWGLLIAVPLFFFGADIAALIDSSEPVIAVAATYLALVPLSYGLWGVLMMASASLMRLASHCPVLRFLLAE